MRRTLFHLPHEIAGLPLFGFGWALGLWLIACGVMAYLGWSRKQALGDRLISIAVMALVAFGIVVVMPWLQAKDVAGDPIGLPIRGYGAFLVVAVLSGVLLAAHRAQKAGLNPDAIYSLAMHMFVAGIVGARLFHVIQYWHTFQGETLPAKLLNALKFTEGGLVVYGALIGGLIAFIFFCKKHNMSWLALGDVIAPSLALGQAIGRLGCLMNGCCFGGVCDEGPAIHFPQDSQPYVHQVLRGDLLGMELEAGDKNALRRVVSVRGGGIADRLGVQQGTPVRIQLEGDWWKPVRGDANPDNVAITIWTSNKQLVGALSLKELPTSSLSVHPTQLYSSLNSALLCLVLLAYYPLRRRDGETLALLLTLYPITRFVLEMIRTDEVGKFGTTLTISQWISIGLLCAAALLWSKLLRSPRGKFAKLSGFGAAQSAQT